MGLRYDWEIEAEKTRVQRSGEGPVFARKRRAARASFLDFHSVCIGDLCRIVGFVAIRLQSVEREIEQSLRSTVEAEVTALRLGDFSSFSTIQRSASPDWLHFQQIFNQYQDLKMQQDVQLSGEISDIQVDRTRARVNVQEIVNGVPYTRVWFYWHYDDGWRHVPPDYTFWGETEVQKIQNVTVRYKMVDKVFGKAVAKRVAVWFQTTCATLACGTAPDHRNHTDETLQVNWVSGDQWWLQIPSPYVRRARSDMPFDVDGQIAVAEKIADRLITQASNNLQPVYPADAVYLRQAVIQWLVGQMVQVNSNSYLIDSLTTNYGVQAVGQLLAAFRPDFDNWGCWHKSQKSLDQTGLDWADYLTWRLGVEDDLLQKRDEANFLALYDTRDSAVRDSAYTRFNTVENAIKKTYIGANGSWQ